MASSRISLPQHKKPSSIDHVPKSLKEFLKDPSDSCSSSGFKAFPRHLPIDSRKPSPDPITISAFQSLIKAVKNIHFITAVKPPSFLPRSLSRRLSKKASKSKNSKEAVKISVRVKDILRWTSFRDVADIQEKPQPLDCFSPSPNRCTTTTTRSADSFCTTNNTSSNFSWCESDFTAEFLPSPSGAMIYDVGDKKLPHVGVDSVKATPLLDLPRDPQDDEDISLYNEEEQQSPVSVFDFEFGENEEPLSPFDQSLANVERAKNSLIEKIKEFESLSNLDTLNLEKWNLSEEEEEVEEECVEYNCEETEEERARELLIYVKATSSIKCGDQEDDNLLLDFFMDELRALKNDQSFVYNGEIVRLAETWLRGGCNGIEFEYGVNREACFREMNKVADWSKFEGEQEDLALEVGDGIFEDLVEELLVDLLVN